MKRKIIAIDENKCNGCGACITACSEGALAIIDGKARLVKDSSCDGFGDCLGECPTGALKIIEREAGAFDAAAHPSAPVPGGCPGLAMRFNAVKKAEKPPETPAGPSQVIPSELSHWPIQIHLVQPNAPFFRGKELVVMSTCAPLASADVHWRFIRGRAVVVGCPKLDRTEGYAAKLAAILSEPSIPKVIIVRMEPPCCGGLTAIVREAAQLCGRAGLAIEEVTVGIGGGIQKTQIVAERKST